MAAVPTTFVMTGTSACMCKKKKVYFFSDCSLHFWICVYSLHQVVLLCPHYKVTPLHPRHKKLTLYLPVIGMAFLELRGATFHLHIFAVDIIWDIGTFEFNKAKLGIFCWVKYNSIRGGTKPGRRGVHDKATRGVVHVCQSTVFSCYCGLHLCTSPHVCSLPCTFEYSLCKRVSRALTSDVNL